MKSRAKFLGVILVILLLGLIWSVLSAQQQGTQAFAPTDVHYNPLLTKVFATAYALVTLTSERSVDLPNPYVQVTKAAHERLNLGRD